MPVITGWYAPAEPDKLLYVVDRVHSRQTHWIDLARRSAACFGRNCVLCENFPQKLEVILPVHVPGASVVGLLKIPSSLLASDALLELQKMGKEADGQAIQLTDWYGCPSITLIKLAPEKIENPRCDAYVRSMGIHEYRRFAKSA